MMRRRVGGPHALRGGLPGVAGLPRPQHLAGERRGLSVPPVPSDDDRLAEIEAVRATMTPEQCDNIRLRCKVSVSCGLIFTDASLPKPVLTP